MSACACSLRYCSSFPSVGVTREFSSGTASRVITVLLSQVRVTRLRCLGPDRLDEPIEFRGIQTSGHPQCSAECSAPARLAQTLRIGMQPRTSTGEPSLGIGPDDEPSGFALPGHDPEQVGGQPFLPATHTCTHRLTGSDTRRHRQFTLNHRPLYRCIAVISAFCSQAPVVSRPTCDSEPGAASLRISIRHPVNRAARRAF